MPPASPPPLFSPVPGVSAEIIPQQFNLDASFDWNLLSTQFDNQHSAAGTGLSPSLQNADIVNWENWDDAVRQFGSAATMDVEGADGVDFGLGPTIGGSHHWY